VGKWRVGKPYNIRFLEKIRFKGIPEGGITKDSPCLKQGELILEVLNEKVICFAA